MDRIILSPVVRPKPLSTGRGSLLTRSLALALSLQLLTPTVLAQTLSQTEQQKLLASDSASHIYVGQSISLSGNRLLVGADYDDARIRTGSVFVYERDEQGTWEEVAMLTASDGESGDRFGAAVALSGDRALIGAVGDHDAGGFAGSAYFFERSDEGVWEEVAKFIPTYGATASDAFGFAVAISGDRAMVGAISSDGPRPRSGAVYYYERDERGTWKAMSILTASDGTWNQRFGSSVALSGDRAVIGAAHQEGFNKGPGSAYVFDLDEDGTWRETAKLSAHDGSGVNMFGDSVALSGDRALIGAYRDDHAGGWSGAAYLYEQNDVGTWEEVTKLTASDAAKSDNFGSSVALLDDRAVIGAQSGAPNSAYVYQPDEEGTWREVSKLIASDTEPYHYFGSAVALSPDQALVGAPFDNSTDLDVGAVYVFDVAGLADGDQDGVIDAQDNCPADLNPLQENFDEDRLGDVCDLDDDNDGVDDLSDPYPLNPALPGGSGLPPLIVGSADKGKYGFRFEGVNNHREILERSFDASGSDLTLTITGYDIDTRQEVRVLVNGTEIGFLSTSNNRGRRISQFTIPQRLLNNAGKNTLRFEQSNPGWSWGVTNLLLSEINDSGELPLVLDTVDSGKYGFRFEGVNSHRAVLERQFDANGTTDLTLTLTGFDIDTRQEVRVLVNGIQIGFLSETPNNGRSSSQLLIVQSLLNANGNTLSFEQLNPGWRWGVSDLLLSARAGTN